MAYFQGSFGLVVICLLAWAISENRRAVSWKLPLAGIGLQLVIAALLLKLPVSRELFLWMNSLVLAIEQATEAGTKLVFGYLGGGPLPFEEPFPGAAWILAFRGLPIILVMSALSGLLFYWKILPLIVRGFSWLLRRSLGIGGAVGVSAAANVFVGMVEAPLFVKPYLLRLTRAELFMVMSVGLSTVAGTVMVLYATILGHVIPGVLGHILTASIISAPAALLIARLMVPDNGEATEADRMTPPAEADSAMEAIVNSTGMGIKLIANIIAMLIVIVALVYLVNQLFAFLPNVDDTPLTIQRITGWIFAPLAWLMGMSWNEALVSGELFGTRLVLTEFVAYLDMSKLPMGTLSERANVIMLYGLCGFASLPSLGIMIGGLGAMVPERRAEILELGFKSVLAATLATAMTGTVAGLLSF
ncbi:NupC/NupG family nucleoside CNT transporter [Aestuariispira insulae]|uniref:CNT family concentrative nucleoside transporter n=1 Tax=Aestuariispira insulae TaxID=1461337 RepID=A0A3D9HX86_9PROT|nr:nucleoside transporter C-terminal domain-containing protein [Aestuariispira insulae]RED54030.1 CNT family concentrative nucleoside transporter [Aestuariispira insulae]